MKKILINFAHPNISKSLINASLLNSLADLPVEVRSYITVNDLYAKYPDFNINTTREKKLLLKHDIVLLQHPVYWYSSPAIIKEWLDRTLEFGFAYGPQGDALKGKTMQNILTTGGPQESYMQTGYNNHSIADFFQTFQQTAILCQMNYLEPYINYSANVTSESMISDIVSKYQKHIINLISSKD